jgi:amylosucrase
MEDKLWLEKQAKLTLERLMPRLDPLLKGKKGSKLFKTRLKAQFPAIFRLLHSLYGDQYDFFYHLEQILATAARMSLERPTDLKALDAQREGDALWFKSEQMVGGVCYVDLFAGDLTGIQQKIPYFKELGLTYLHLMPLFKTPEGNSDGGYAVSDYRQVAPNLGTMEQLTELATALRKESISLVVDFVFNHTADDHTWAKRARAGDEAHQNYYFLFDDRTMPDQYERHLRDIFPEQDPGSFTYLPKQKKWVWTTFNHFQWDLNYRNPAVFNAMLEELLFLANQGVEVLRLDAVAFIWKQMGTSCENLPQAHTIIQAFNALVRVAAPAMLFKSEAIVHPDDVASYISWQECPISYNPTLMALLWEALATREVKLLRHSMHRRFAMPDDCAWVNYVRCHDDIGWTFADEDAAELGINGFDHRQFLNRFYIGRFAGSHACGLPFNYNPLNQDMRISGTMASLAGLEQALDLHNALYLEYSIARILLIHSVIMSVGGIPLLYLGDEIATLNDYSYQDDPTKKEDSRWAHRPKFDWKRAKHRSDTTMIEGRIFQGLLHLIEIRKQTAAFSLGNTIFFDTGNPQVLGYVCDEQVLVLANFSEYEQPVFQGLFGYYDWLPDTVRDLLSKDELSLTSEITLKPYQFHWLKLDEG